MYSLRCLHHLTNVYIIYNSTHISIFVFSKSVEVKWLIINEELGLLHLHCSYTHR